MEAALLAGEAAIRRDPRQSPFGFLAGGEFVHQGTEVFMWFDSLPELAAHLLDVEPLLLSSLSDGPDIEAYRDRIRPALEQLELQGFHENARLDFNQAAEGFMLIEWWGKFEELKAGLSPTSRELLTWFRDPGTDEGDGTPPLADEEVAEFVEFLQSW